MLQRPGLVLDKNVPGHSGPVVFAAFGSTHDAEPYHGWLVGWDAQSLNQYSVFNDTPNGYGGSLWQSGGAPVVMPNGDIVITSGNGAFDAQTTTAPGPNALGFADFGLGYAGIDHSAAVTFSTVIPHPSNSSTGLFFNGVVPGAPTPRLSNGTYLNINGSGINLRPCRERPGGAAHDQGDTRPTTVRPRRSTKRSSTPPRRAPTRTATPTSICRARSAATLPTSGSAAAPTPAGPRTTSPAGPSAAAARPVNDSQWVLQPGRLHRQRRRPVHHVELGARHGRPVDQSDLRLGRHRLLQQPGEHSELHHDVHLPDDPHRRDSRRRHLVHHPEQPGPATGRATTTATPCCSSRPPPGTTTVADYFTPADQQGLAIKDLDFGTAGTLVLPPPTGSSTPADRRRAGQERRPVRRQSQQHGPRRPADPVIPRHLDSAPLGTHSSSIGLWGAMASPTTRCTSTLPTASSRRSSSTRRPRPSTPPRSVRATSRPCTSPATRSRLVQRQHRTGSSGTSRPTSFDWGGPAILHAYDANNLTQPALHQRQQPLRPGRHGRQVRRSPRRGRQGLRRHRRRAGHLRPEVGAENRRRWQHRRRRRWWWEYRRQQWRIDLEPTGPADRSGIRLRYQHHHPGDPVVHRQRVDLAGLHARPGVPESLLHRLVHIERGGRPYRGADVHPEPDQQRSFYFRSTGPEPDLVRAVVSGQPRRHPGPAGAHQRQT